MMWQNLYGVSDRGITLLLKFMEAFVSMLASLLEVPMLTEFAKIFPTSLYKVRKLLGLNRDKFVKYVACPKCHTVYKFEDCYRVNSRGEKHPLKCSAVKFPNHPQKKRRKPCHAALLKKVISKDGHGYVYPINVYCYKSVRETLETFVRRPDFLKKCNAWRFRNVPNGVLHDIYDGQVWKDFTDNGFFKTDYDLSFTLNVDWFQPFEHSPYSAGALYMIINNLPREERFNPENVILVGLMPGPKEAKKNINSYLQPLVDELEQLLQGVHINDGTLFGNNYRGALMCLSSDIPACRKCGGFVGHGAMRGCSKCLHAFPRAAFGKKADYSNFCMENIEPRTDEDHIFFASQVRNASTPAEQKKFEYEYGARWTELNRLPYYLPVRFHVIDPMHNLLLGTAKHVVEVWKKQKILTSEHFETIQSRVDKLKVPGNVGRIPRKIASGFSDSLQSSGKTG
ncbi:uncharacterized protein [Ptychodera flava]|uniref:uncharacterized protein n=1 Tax=Ptychodera flava TaxID=63121 RepID=UPI00396A3B40